MKGSGNRASKGIMCFLTVWLVMLVSPVWTCGELVTIDFEYLPDGTPIEHGTPVTDAYADYGVTFHCFGLFPDYDAPGAYQRDNNSYAYEDDRALSGRNVIGGRVIGDYYHWLSFDLCYGVAEFTNAVNYISIYGAGAPFQVFAYDQGGSRIGAFSSPRRLPEAGYLLEISLNDALIKRIEFGGWMGGYTYFDDLTFPRSQPVPVIDEIVPSACEPGQEITIIGHNFGDDQGDSVVHIGKKILDSSNITSWSDTEIHVEVPEYKCRRFRNRDSGKRRVWVTVGGVDSNAKILTIMKPDICP